MTISRATFSLLPPSGNEKIKSGTLSYFRVRNRGELYSILVKEFKKSGITQKQLADRLGKDTAVVSRILSAPGNMEADTVSDFLFAISGASIVYDVTYPLVTDRKISSPAISIATSATANPHASQLTKPPVEAESTDGAVPIKKKVNKENNISLLTVTTGSHLEYV